MNRRIVRTFACLVALILTLILSPSAKANPYGPVQSTTLFIGSFGKPHGVSQIFSKWDEVVKQYPDLATQPGLEGESLHSYFRHGGTRVVIASTQDLKVTLVDFDSQILETRFDFLIAPSLALLPTADFDKASAALARVIEARRALFLFDLPVTGTPDDHKTLLQTWSSKKLTRAAAFAPTLKTATGALIPPGAAMAALLTRSDRDIGPWKNPSGAAFRLAGDDVLSVNVGDSQCTRWLSSLPSSVNCLRTHQGRVISWGSRLMPVADPDNRYISVRRAQDYFERETEDALKWVLDAQAGDATCAKIITQLEWQLYAHMQLRALVGNSASEAFYVRCGLGQTMTNADLRAGRTIVEIGLAFLRPSEFTVIRNVFQKTP